MWKDCCSLLSCCIFLCVHSRGEAKKKGMAGVAGGLLCFGFMFIQLSQQLQSVFCLFWSTVALLSVTSAKCSFFFFVISVHNQAFIQTKQRWLQCSRWCITGCGEMCTYIIQQVTRRGFCKTICQKSDQVSRCFLLWKGVIKVFVFKGGCFNLA